MTTTPKAKPEEPKPLRQQLEEKRQGLDEEIKQQTALLNQLAGYRQAIAETLEMLPPE